MTSSESQPRTEASERFIEWVEDTMRPQFTRGGDYQTWLADARRMAAKIEEEAMLRQLEREQHDRSIEAAAGPPASAERVTREDVLTADEESAIKERHR